MLAAPVSEDALQMYLDYYQLTHDPFTLTPDPACLFCSPGHQQALDALTYGVTTRQGFILLTGARGVGKTTLLRAYLAQEQPAPLTTIVLPDANIAFPELLLALCQACGLEVAGATLFEMQTQFQQFLLEAYRHSRNVALCIDDAHRLPLATLDQLWLLTNFDLIAAKLLQIVLVGPPEIEQHLQQHALRHIAQRVTVRVAIVPLTAAESVAYLQQRLAAAAQPGHPVFTRGALKRLARAAHGIPQCLHVLGTQALLTGYAVRQQPITARLAQTVIAECQETPSAPWWSRSLADATGCHRMAWGLWRALRGRLRPTAVAGGTQPGAPTNTPGECSN